jgi:hypothetical protein
MKGLRTELDKNWGNFVPLTRSNCIHKIPAANIWLICIIAKPADTRWIKYRSLLVDMNTFNNLIDDAFGYIKGTFFKRSCLHVKR